MCKGCCTASAGFLIKFIDFCLVLAGLTIVVYGVVLIAKAPSPYSTATPIFGSTVLIVGLIGLLSMSGRRPTIQAVSVGLLMLSAAGSLAALLWLILEGDDIVDEWVADDDDVRRRWVADNVHMMKFAVGILAATELFCALLTCWYRSQFTRVPVEPEHRSLLKRNVDSQNRKQENAQRRKELSKKYGQDFSKGATADAYGRRTSDESDSSRESEGRVSVSCSEGDTETRRPVTSTNPWAKPEEIVDVVVETEGEGVETPSENEGNRSEWNANPPGVSGSAYS
eukprot:516174_1